MMKKKKICPIYIRWKIYLPNLNTMTNVSAQLIWLEICLPNSYMMRNISALQIYDENKSAQFFYHEQNICPIHMSWQKKLPNLYMMKHLRGFSGSFEFMFTEFLKSLQKFLISCLLFLSLTRNHSINVSVNLSKQSGIPHKYSGLKLHPWRKSRSGQYLGSIVGLRDIWIFVGL